jgi:hypothetical protein
MTVILSPARRFESPPGEPILDWRGLAGRKNGQQLLFTYRAWSLEVDLTTRTLHCSGPDPDPAGCLGFRESFLLNAVLVVIHRYGFFELHAAAGAHHATGYLLLGPSGSGKTTALVSLVTSGWNYLTDDAVVVSQSPGGGISAHPLRRSFSFKPDLLDRYPELATYATDHVIETDKRRLDPRELWPRQAVSMISPKFIVACGLADEKKSSISPISRAESLARLAGSTPWLMLDQATAAAHLEVFRALAASCCSFELRAGHDAYDGGRLARLLDPEALIEQWASFR